MHKRFYRLATMLLATVLPSAVFAAGPPGHGTFYSARDSAFRYMGRVEFRRADAPRFWMPGTAVTARFKGSDCRIFVQDEHLHGSHNYVEIRIDDQPPFRLKVKGKRDTIDVSNRIGGGVHRIFICKDTESGIGYLAFLGLRCDKLLPAAPLPSRKIEFIGNSITCGFGNDLSTPCSAGSWHDHENAYESYGAVTARALHARWHISAVSGIGMMHSCCNMKILMPEVFDETDMAGDSIAWDFSRYQPDVVTVCLGQNDGVQDSTLFCSAYAKFVKRLRACYPHAKIICLGSPMAGAKLAPVLKKYISSVVAARHAKGDAEVYAFFFSRQFNHGCMGHPSMQEDREIAAELTPFVRKIAGW